MLKAFIFDLDGTLFDSTEANVQAYTKAFEQTGVEFDEVKYRQLFGLRYKEMIEAISPGLSPEKAETIRQLKPSLYAEALDFVRPNTALLKLAGSVQGQFQTALVTTASKVNVANLLEHFGFDIKLFDAVITGEDVDHGKPDPECYVKAMSRLNVGPEECLIFEDSDVGLEAARRAGVEAVKVAM
jgi:beta-phosphoglucomutase